MKSNKIAGFLLIIFGALYLTFQVLGQMDIVLFRIWDFWPLITITLGVMFEALYFNNRKNYGFLIPGGILTTIGVLHLFETVTNWYFSAYTWPIYVFAVFVGFFQIYVFTKQNWAFVVSLVLFCVTVFLSMIALSVFIGNVGIDMAFSALIIVIGLILLFGSRVKKK